MTARIVVTRKGQTVLLEVPRQVMRHRDGIRNFLFTIGQMSVAQAQRLIRTGPKTGRVYIIRGRRHRASAPGQPPANLTGRLAGEVDYEVRGFDQMEFGDRTFYGVFLEGGTRKMAPRPHLLVATNLTAGQAVPLLYQLVQQELRT